MDYSEIHPVEENPKIGTHRRLARLEEEERRLGFISTILKKEEIPGRSASYPFKNGIKKGTTGLGGGLAGGEVGLCFGDTGYLYLPPTSPRIPTVGSQSFHF